MQVGAKPPKGLRLGYAPPRKRKLHDGKPVPRPAPVPMNNGSAASAMEPSTQTEQAEPEGHSLQQPEPEPMTDPTPPVMAAPASLKQTLRECGYCIVSSALAMTGVPIDADELEAECHSVRTGDDPDGPIHNDPKRRMFSLPRCFTRLLSMCLLARLGWHEIQGNRDECDMRLFVSEPNGSEQMPHCDERAQKTQNAGEDNVLLSGILALEPGTRLISYPDGPHAPSKPIDLAVGDLLVFRGDFWHAGAKYTDRNRRLHMYFTAPGYRRDPGYTYS